MYGKQGFIWHFIQPARVERDMGTLILKQAFYVINYTSQSIKPIQIQLYTREFIAKLLTNSMWIIWLWGPTPTPPKKASPSIKRASGAYVPSSRGPYPREEGGET